MLVRKLKCYSCSGNKVNDITGMYIYCDYCGSWMGLDMIKATQESAEAFSMQNYQNPLQQEYTQVAIKLGEASQSKNIDDYIKAQLRMHELEFELFPKRFGPKVKQTSYVKRYMEFYQKLYEEIVDEKYFDRFAPKPEVSELVGKLKYTLDGGKVIYEWDDNFIKFMEYNISFLDRKDDPMNNAEAIKYHPENVVYQNPEVLKKIALNSMIQPYNVEIQEKIIKHFGFETEYIEIPEVDFSTFDCYGCASELKAPEGSNKVVCEACGNINGVKSKQITCLNCAAEFDPNEGACPYCNSKFQGTGSMGDVVAEAYEKAVEEPIKKATEDLSEVKEPQSSLQEEKPPEKKKGWRGLFGK